MSHRGDIWDGWCPSVKRSEICFYVTVTGCEMGVVCSSVHGSLFGCTDYWHPPV